MDGVWEARLFKGMLTLMNVLARENICTA